MDIDGLQIRPIRMSEQQAQKLDEIAAGGAGQKFASAESAIQYVKRKAAKKH